MLSGWESTFGMTPVGFLCPGWRSHPGGFRSSLFTSPAVGHLHLHTHFVIGAMYSKIDALSIMEGGSLNANAVAALLGSTRRRSPGRRHPLYMRAFLTSAPSIESNALPIALHLNSLTSAAQVLSSCSKSNPQNVASISSKRDAICYHT